MKNKMTYCLHVQTKCEWERGQDRERDRKRKVWKGLQQFLSFRPSGQVGLRKHKNSDSYIWVVSEIQFMKPLQQTCWSAHSCCCLSPKLKPFITCQYNLGFCAVCTHFFAVFKYSEILHFLWRNDYLKKWYDANKMIILCVCVLELITDKDVTLLYCLSKWSKKH